MRAELKRIHQESRSTIVFVTHDQWEAMTLATRVAVMLHGDLQQVGTPLDIYDRPANRFVAGFLGVPPINFFEYTPVAPDAAQTLAFVQGAVPAGTELGSLGIRPEALRVEAADAPPRDGVELRGTIASIMPTGGSWTTDVVVEGRHVYTTSSQPGVVRPGDDVVLQAPRTALHVFDRAGDRVEVTA